ncbi:unnamed protein product [Amoebophrya sp. A120]|nr:unnamed protein product [Amoebophrya sp. A120]|eukprot:GSA120T00014913001.1
MLATGGSSGPDASNMCWRFTRIVTAATKSLLLFYCLAGSSGIVTVAGGTNKVLTKNTAPALADRAEEEGNQDGVTTTIGYDDAYNYKQASNQGSTGVESLSSEDAGGEKLTDVDVVEQHELAFLQPPEATDVTTTGPGVSEKEASTFVQPWSQVFNRVGNAASSIMNRAVRSQHPDSSASTPAFSSGSRIFGGSRILAAPVGAQRDFDTELNEAIERVQGSGYLQVCST